MESELKNGQRTENSSISIINDTIDNVKVNKKTAKKDGKRPSMKIVIRNLPPTMTEEEFLLQTYPLPEHDNYYFCKADWSLGMEATCRAYLTLKHLDDVFTLRDQFDGYVFVDSKGTEYVAIVEYSPFQGLQKKKSRSNDNKENTIEMDAHFKQYLEKLENNCGEPNRLDLKIDFSLDRKPGNSIKSTPLLQYLANKKEKRREDAKKRNEEKRKLREEKQKNLQQNTQMKQTQVVENKLNVQSNTDTTANVVKTSRSKRRFDRDQRRREEHEQKKKSKAQFRREQHDKKELSAQQEKKSQQNKNNEKDLTILQNTKENSNLDKKQTIKKRAQKKESLTESNLIALTPSEEAVSEIVKSTTTTLSNTSTKHNLNLKNTNVIEEDVDDQTNQPLTEERRIRNKDRPSIAIYEPKARMRAPEKETKKSQSKLNVNNSDCEGSCKPESDKNEKCYLGKRSERKFRRKTSEEGISQKNNVSEDGNHEKPQPNLF